jgi:hypothetical protein
MSESRAVALTRELIRCPSVTPADAGALDVVEKGLKAAGFETHRIVFSAPGTPDIDNLFAKIGAGAPHLAFAGHTDVVPPGDPALALIPSPRKFQMAASASPAPDMKAPSPHSSRRRFTCERRARQCQTWERLAAHHRR